MTIAMIRFVVHTSPLKSFVSSVSPRPAYFSVMAPAAVTPAATCVGTRIAGTRTIR